MDRFVRLTMVEKLHPSRFADSARRKRGLATTHAAWLKPLSTRLGVDQYQNEVGCELGRYVAADHLFAVLRNCLPGASPERLATPCRPEQPAGWPSLLAEHARDRRVSRLYFRSGSTQAWEGTVNVGYC
jgi:hypothetical protein